mmetsp:Transcript_57262/g.92762  ORF Transcript_57262/g.92762 Transcript_57262/m.92762 type:complete len:201 (+) Transcript_57262:780-1382(+)
MALGWAAARTGNAEAVLTVHCTKLLVHDDGIRLLQLGKAGFVGFTRLSPELLRVYQCSHLVVSLPHSLWVKAAHVYFEHLEQICAVLQALNLLGYWSTILTFIWDGDRHQRIEVLLGGLAHLCQRRIVVIARLEGDRRSPTLQLRKHWAGFAYGRRHSWWCHSRWRIGRRCHGGRRHDRRPCRCRSGPASQSSQRNHTTR